MSAKDNDRSGSPEPVAALSRAPALRRAAGDRLVAVLLFVVAAGALASVYAGSAAGAVAGVAALVAFCIVGQRHFRLRERLLLAVAVALTAAEVALEPGWRGTVWEALDRASFLAAFMLLLGVLRDAAATSPAVVATGRFMTQQPAGRRYGAIAGGSHLLTVLLNMGALSLLAPLIQAGVRASREAGDPDWIADIKERRQFSASLRGFATVIVWSPTTVTQALLATLFPAAEAVRVILCGLALAALAGVLGWVEDRLRWAGVRRQIAATGQPRRAAAAAPRRAIRDLGLVCGALVGMAAAIRWATGVDTVPALMLAAPVLTTAWIFLQNRDDGAARAARVTAGRVGDILGRSIPASSPEAFTLAAAGYIGVMLSALVPPWLVAAGAEALHPLVLLAVLPVLIVVVVQAALTPIVMAVFIGTALGTLDPLPVDPTLIVLSLAGGWSLALTASPFAAGALVLGRATGIPPTRLTWAWNWLYSLLYYLLLVAWLSVLWAVW